MHTLDIAFLEFINKKKLFKKDDKLLVAVSGGCDSSVLSFLLYQNGFTFSLAHCNFHLRGSDSNADELFVEKLAENYNVKLYKQHFETNQYAIKNKYSIEEAARVLRYQWFEDLRETEGFDYIVTAHHLNDKVETMFINIAAGTGIKGLRSIKEKNGFIVRPLLFAEKKSIEQYAENNKIEYRFDKSNLNTDIVRNRVRKNIIPEFEKINVSFLKKMEENFEILDDIEIIYENYISTQLDSILRYDGGKLYINRKKILKKKPLTSILFEALSPYGFNASQIKLITRSLPSLQTGKFFESKDYKLVIDRKYLVIEKKDDNSKEKHFIINSPDETINYPVKLKFELFLIQGNFQIKRNSNYAYFDADKVKFPLVIRKKVQADRFVPFGMSGSKLISDFITDNKLSYSEKQSLYLLTDSDEILWVIGYRINEKYKLDQNSKKVLLVKLNK
jgi:tRNA(Ile)-lysidine synthase